MHEPHAALALPTRRDFIALAAAGTATAAVTAMLAGPAMAQAAPWSRLGEARKLIGDATPVTTGLTMDLPLLSEDGSSVPLTVTADSPMTADDHIVSIALFASRNPSAEIAEFRFTPLAGRAQLQTRVRLNETQTVIAVARTSKGIVHATSRDIRITTSGCLMRAGGSESAGEMQPRVRAPARGRRGEPVEILTLISHPMETGLREAPGGGMVPERIIRSFVARLGGETVIEATFHRSLGANPYLRFFVRPQASGTLAMTWTEDSGRTAEAKADIAAG